MRALRLWLLFAIAFGTITHAQSRREERVEFIGLKTWTVDMVADSLARHAPGTPLGSAACAEVLRERFGFAEAGVLRYGDGSTVVLVIEPQDSSRVRPRRFARIASPNREAWEGLLELRRGDFTAFRFAIDTYLAAARVRDSLLGASPVDSVIVRSVWKTLNAQASTGVAAPLRALSSDPNRNNRVAAAFLLLNYSDDDATWRALLESFGDEDGQVRVAARMSLWAMTKSQPRAVDWSPSAPVIRRLLNGTSVVWSSEVQNTLIATGASPALGRLVLDPVPELLLAQSAARHEKVGGTAREILMRLTAQDFGADSARWRQWLVSRR